MTPDRYRQVCAVFETVIGCDPARRQAILMEECAGDSDLKAQVEQMLVADADASRASFLEMPTDVFINAAPVTEGPGDRVGPYKILQTLGEGGMGVVFLAEQGEPVRRRVALKLIKPGMDSAQVIARFAAERQALALMDHPNIAKVLDAGTTESGRPYFVMELVKGVPITEYCDRNKLKPRRRLGLFIPVCRAIQHAHQKGIIHRDIKPSNVLVTLVDGEPVAKVIDFGVAKAIDQRLTEQTIFTQMGVAVGTLEYMSPEQADLSALDVDTRSDVYSLGVLLYELLTGSTPLERSKLRQAAYAEIVRRIQEEEPPKPSTRLSNSGDRRASIAACRGEEPARLSKLVRGELDWIAMKAIEKDRTRRYETANGLARDIERYLEGEAVEAGPPSARYQLRKFARRHRVALATAAAFAVMLVVAAAGSTYLAIRARAAEDLANERLARATAAEAEKSRALDETKAAKAKTDLALKESEASRTRAEELSKYLVESFRKPDPTLDGRTLKVVDLLEQAVRNLDERFATASESKGELLNAIGETYLGLGLPQQSIEIHTKAVAVLNAALGDRHNNTLSVRNNLAAAYVVAGRTAEAIEIHERDLKIREADLGRVHPDTLISRNNLASAYMEFGRLEDAARLHEQTLRVMEAQLGPEDRRTLTTRNNVAEGYSSLGRIREAISLHEQTLKLREKTLGRDHPDTLMSRDNLALAYTRDGRALEAIRMGEETLALYQSRLGEDHPDTLKSRNNLAMAYAAAGRYSDSVRFHEVNLKLNESKMGHDHAQTLQSVSNLAISYQGAGDAAHAEPLFRRMVKHHEKIDGVEHPAVGAFLAELGVSLLTQKKYAEAEPFLKRSVAIRTKSQPEAWNTFNVISLLGGSLLGQKKYVESEPLLQMGYEGLKKRAPNIPPQYKRRVTEAAKRIVALYEARGMPIEAAAWREKLNPSPDRLPADVFAPPESSDCPSARRVPSH